MFLGIKDSKNFYYRIKYYIFNIFINDILFFVWSFFVGELLGDGVVFLYLGFIVF